MTSGFVLNFRRITQSIAAPRCAPNASIHDPFDHAIRPPGFVPHEGFDVVRTTCLARQGLRYGWIIRALRLWRRGTSAPVVVDGWDTYGYVAHVTCGAHPVLLNGDRTDVTLDGSCARVMVAGDHNDVSVALVPDGTIDITGDHNDVTWHMPAGYHGAPVLLNHGHSNTYHAEE